MDTATASGEHEVAVTVERRGHVLLIGLNRPACRPTAVDRAIEIATMVAEKSAPLGVRTVFASAHRAAEHGDRAAIEDLRPDIARLVATADGAEGIQSFVERRAAVFTGR